MGINSNQKEICL